MTIYEDHVGDFISLNQLHEGIAFFERFKTIQLELEIVCEPIVFGCLCLFKLFGWFLGRGLLNWLFALLIDDLVSSHRSFPWMQVFEKLSWSLTKLSYVCFISFSLFRVCDFVEIDETFI